MSERPTASRLVAVAGFIGLLLTAACSSPTVPGNAGDGGDGGQGGQQTTAQGGDTGGDAGGDANVELCTLVSEDQIAEITGNEVTDAASGESGDCTWTIGDTDAINLRYESSYDAGLAIAEQVCDEDEPVTGVGDEALWCPGISVLYFNTGNRSLAVQLIYILEEPGRPEMDIAVEIAQAALGGL